MSYEDNPKNLDRTGMPRIACVGGFLGSGKTTAIIQAARVLMDRGVRIGIITNDQGHPLVDTALVRGLGFPAEEIGGGCFCCRFAEFAVQAHRLVEQFRAEVILAEAVGSCTDLSATVCRRMRQHHSAQFVLAPLTVMVDPARVREMLGTHAPFDEDVRYLFAKQLAEADRIIVTKRDLLEGDEISSLQEAIQQLVGDSPVSAISAKTGAGVRDWVEQILTGQAGERDLQLDYGTYGRAEASLGWLNASIDLVAEREFSPSDLGEGLVAGIQEALRLSGCAVAHVKIMFATAEGSDWIALTESRGKPAWGGERELSPSREASMIINARVCAEPEHLRQVVEESVQQASADRSVRATVCHIESFSPVPPKPPGVMTVHPGEN
jgi:G3E family GTPase